MTILDVAATPRRQIFPGELAIGVGNARLARGSRNTPAGVSIRLLSGDCDTGAQMVALSVYGLLAKDGVPVMITGGPEDPGAWARLVRPADLAVFTGQALAAEITGHVRGLLAGFRPEDTWLHRVLRFRDIAGYNDLLCDLAARYLGVTRTDTLLSLRADTEKNIRLQAGWYASHGPSAPGQTHAGYAAETAAFRSLTSAWLKAVNAELPAA